MLLDAEGQKLAVEDGGDLEPWRSLSRQFFLKKEPWGSKSTIK